MNTPSEILSALESLRNKKVNVILHAGNCRVMIVGELVKPRNARWSILNDESSVVFDTENVTKIQMGRLPDIYLV